MKLTQQEAILLYGIKIMVMVLIEYINSILPEMVIGCIFRHKMEVDL